MTNRALDVQVGGGHYKEAAIQPIEFIFANKIGFAEGNVIKYVFRYSKKNGIEDLKKAKHYIELLIEEAERASARSPLSEVSYARSGPFTA